MNTSPKGDAARLVPFVPSLTVDMARRGDGNVHDRIDASMLSADISGFTALSEALADKGREGAEELTRLINSCFVALIEAAYGYGGEVLKFGGDAILIMFRGDDHLRRSGRAAQAMQLVLRQTSAARRADLAMTVGVAEGPFDVFLVGSSERELLVCGEAATEVIRLESSASAGETLATAAIADALTARGHDGATVIWDQPTAPPGRTIDAEDLTRYVPPTVAEQLGAFSDVGGEHRLVAIGFVSVSGVDAALSSDGGPAVATQLGDLLDHVHHVCRRYSVTPLHSDIAPDGLKLVLSAGAPQATATPGDAMLKATLDIARTTSPFVVKQGVQVGRVFAGFLGSEYRRTYTLMGDPVNTAARMLGQAGDRDVIAVHDVVLETRSVFIEEELEPFQVKGKTEPIIAHRIVDATDEVRRRGDWIPFVGRAAERELLEQRIPAGGVAIEIVGAGGSGKTRLVEEAAEIVDREGYLRFQAVCSPYGGTAPYSLVRSLIRNGLGVDMHLDDDSTGELLTKVVQQFAAHLRPMVPLIALAVGANVESTPEFEALAPENRRERLHEAVVAFLGDAFDRPVAMIAEDVHWIDDASRDLLAFAAHQAIQRNWVMVATRRHEGEPVLAETGSHAPTETDSQSDGSGSPDRPAIELGPMDDDSMRAIVLGNARRALSDQQVATVLSRAAGNPLFAVELARIITNGSADHLPDSVEKIVSARLDRLPPDARRFLRIASVVGVEMEQVDLLSILAAEAPGLVPPWDDVGEFFTPRPDGTATFTNIVTHDAAYEGLPFGSRRRIHRAVGEHLEAKESADKLAPLLARHFSEGRDHRRAWRYGKHAGALAAAEQANVEAAANYGRALASARYVRRLPSSEVVDVAMRLGDAHLVLAHFDDARTAWQYARKKNDDLSTELAIMRSFGAVEHKQGRMDAALRWYTRAQSKLDAQHPAGDHETDSAQHRALALEAARIELAVSAIHVRRADFHETASAARKALGHIDRASGDPNGDVIATALDRLQVSVNNLREPDVENFGTRALDAYLKIGDHAGAARVLNNMGVGAYFRGEWDAAAEHYTRSVTEGLKAGAVVDGVFGSLNAGEVLSDQGHLAEARQQLENALRNWESAGYAIGIAAARLFLAVVERRNGNWRAARELLDDAISRIEQLGLDELLADARTRLLEVDLYEGRPDLNRIDSELDSLGIAHPLAGRVRRIRGVARHLHGDSGAASEELCEVLANSDGFERLLTLRALVHVDPASPEAAARVAEADEIAELLGVVRTAPLPSHQR